MKSVSNLKKTCNNCSFPFVFRISNSSHIENNVLQNCVAIHSKLIYNYNKSNLKYNNYINHVK